MSFAADLKDFASNFRDTYKTLHVSGRDEYYDELAKSTREERAAKARAEVKGEAAAGGRGNVPDARATRTATGDFSDPDLIPKVIAAEGGDPHDVAEVIRNRAEAAKVDPVKVVTYKGAFEPISAGTWTDQPEDRVAAAREAWAKVNTEKLNRLGGATHFYDADTQAKLGRPAPAWDTGEPVAVRRGGARRFFRRPGDRFALDPEQAVPVVYAAQGGVIPSGRALSLDTTENESAGSNPVTRDVYDAERSNMSDDDFDPRQLVDVEGARTAVAGGLKFLQRTLGLETHHAAVPEAASLNPDGVTALQTNAGAMKRQELNAAIDPQVDPKGQLPPALREIARYNAMQQFWEARGEPERANRMAAQMLQASKKAAALYGAAALAVDDPVKRLEVITRGYNELIPDGDTVKVTGKAPGGAKFEVHDAQGRVTEKGVMAMDDMIKIATGMSNGTEYLRGMVNFATSAPSAADKLAERKEAALERRRTALADYDEAAPDTDIVMSRLTDKQREILKRGDLDPGDRAKVLNEARQKLDIERKQFNTELKNTLTQERYDRSEDMKLFQTAVRLGMWDETRNQVMTMHEQKLAELRAQEEGRNARQDESLAARRRREQEIDKRILEKRTKTTDGAGMKMGAREAAENRRVAGVEGVAADRMSAIDTAASDETGVNLSNEQRARRGAIAVGATFDRNLKEDDKSRKGRAEAMNETYDELVKLNSKLFDINPQDQTATLKKGVPADAANQLTGAAVAAADIVRSTGLPASVAARTIDEVLQRKRPIQIEQRGAETLVHLGNDIPPVRMSEDGFLQIMRMVGGQDMSKQQIQALQGPSWSNSPALPVDVRASTPGGRQSILGRIFEPVRDTPPNRVPSALPPRALDLPPALPEPGRKNTLINRMIDQYRR